jgi:transmembrane sensor
MEETRLNYLYHKNLQQACTKTELLELEAFTQDPNHAFQLECLMNASWDLQPEESLPEISSDRIFGHIIQQDQLPANPERFNWKPLLKVAAAVLLLVSSGLLIKYKWTSPSSEPISMAAAGSQIQSTITASDKHQLVKLPDGSTVVLNQNSKLEYPAVFGDKREVVLTGEGYFDVKHDPEKSFIVHTGKIKTTVLGTAFNIKAYSNEEKVTVTVTRGKVSVQDEKQTLGVITPNQQLVFNKTEEKKVQLNVPALKAIEWQAKDLFFDDMTMEQAARMLEQRFSVKIAFANNAVKNCRFTGTILKAEKIESVLNMLCSFNSSSYDFHKGVYMISGTGCSD